ncbi:glycosyltransferase [Caenimonas aquaedulcis]|uniref:Glycosyltransferase n=1 Tax=Caenimonas aquaedulcis TaxID=2793270 RepID=A0A931H5K8_9BURK|nr:glycosyltransferase [Caenimonas aquaedulcis]MBG9388887.1 glycosyltransferase [Caenimonas aquaedulcis]
MSAAPRVFMDVSYTRTQRVAVGITRTVRRLEEELRSLCAVEGIDFRTVSFHTQGFREMAPDALAATIHRADACADAPAARLFRWITGAFFRRLVLIALHVLPWRLLRFIWATTSRKTFDVLSRTEPAVAFSPGDVLLLFDASWNYPVWIAAAKARAQGARVVLLMYDLIPLRHPDFTHKLVPPIFRLWLQRMLPLSDAVVCISRATEDDLHLFARETAMALPPTGHFRLGSDPVRTPAAGRRPRDELEAFTRGGPTFAAIGSFEPKKNYGFLLEVFERLWARGEPARLLLIGRASAECEALIARVRQHPEQGRRLLALFDATDAEVDFAYANCRALVFPSLAEGFGLPLVEARTRGSLVIASDLPCFAELADEGVETYPRDSHAALERLVLHHAAHDRRGEVAPMPPFTWGQGARQCWDEASRLLAGVSQPVPHRFPPP